MNSDRTGTIFRSSFGITVISFIGTLFGFFTQIILAARYGTTSEMDAYLVSNTIPFMIIAIFMGSLNYTFVPVFVDNKSRGQEDQAWNAANNLFNICSLIFGTISLIGIVYSREVIDLIAPGLDPVTKETAVVLSRIQMPSILLAATSALLSSIYYSEKMFLLPTFANLSNSVILFAFVYWFSDTYGIRAIAIGTLMGSIVGFLILVPRLLKKYRFVFQPRDGETAKIVRLMIPLLAGAVFYRADNLIQRYIASSLTAGSISYIGYASKLISTTSSLIVSGISVVLLSHVSEMTSKKDSKGVGDTFLSIYKWLTYILIPSIVLIVVLGEDIIRILFQRGQFDELSTYNTWICMMLYCGVFYGGIIGSIVTPIFYAYKDTITVVKVGVIGALLQLILSYGMSRYLSFSGLPLAYSISNLLTISVFIVILNRKYIRIDLKAILKMLCSGICIGMAIAALLWEIKILYLGDINAVLRMGILTFAGSALYLAATFLAKNQEAKILVDRIRIFSHRIVNS